jgi:hypothetical protein
MFPRAISAGRVALGIGLLIRPHRLATLASFGGRCPANWLVRLLGGRMLAQSALELATGDRRVLRLSAAIDVLHAVSMLAVAARRTRYRRVALASAGLAGASAAALLAGRANPVGRVS